MLNQERLEALHAIKAGTVKVRLMNAAGSAPLYEPREMTVSLGFLQKAGLAQVHTQPEPNGLRSAKILLTERGEHVAQQSA